MDKKTWQEFKDSGLFCGTCSIQKILQIHKVAIEIHP